MKTFHTSSWVRLFAFVGAVGTGLSLAIGGSIAEGIGIIAAAVSSPLVTK